MRYKGILLAVILTMQLGRVIYNGHPETFYCLPMGRVVQRAAENGIQGEYWERKDGCKMYGQYIIVAADWTIHPYGSIVQTSRGDGIVLDHIGDTDKNTIDLATTWRRK